MAKALTKSQIADNTAEKTGVTKKVSIEMLDALTQLAYEEAKNSFTLPGIGKLVLVDRKARTGRNPQTGEAIEIPARHARMRYWGSAQKASRRSPERSQLFVELEGLAAPHTL